MANNEHLKQSIKQQREVLASQQVNTRRLRKTITKPDEEVAGVAYLKQNNRESYQDIYINGDLSFSGSTYATYATHPDKPVAEVPQFNLDKQEPDSTFGRKNESPTEHDLEVQAEREAIRVVDLIHPTDDDRPPATILEGSRRRSVVQAYRKHAPRSSVAMVSPEGADSWVLLEYDDGTHVTFNNDWSVHLC
jgi:hypothetical protein